MSAVVALGCVAVAPLPGSHVKDAATLLLACCKPCTTPDRRTHRICSALHQTMEEHQSQCCCLIRPAMEEQDVLDQEAVADKIKKSPILYKC